MSNRCAVGQRFEQPRSVQVHRYVKRRTLRRLLRLGSIVTCDEVTTAPTLRPPVGDNPPQKQLPPQLRDDHSLHALLPGVSALQCCKVDWTRPGRQLLTS